MPRQGREHAVGPYARKGSKKLRVFFYNAKGVRTFEDYESHDEAVKDRDAYNAAAGSRTVGEAVAEYLMAHAAARGNETTRFRLSAILRMKEGDRPLDALTAPLARELYARRVKECAPDTHRGELSYAKRFIDWCIAQGWLRINPFVGIKPEGEKNTRADQQLRVNEARRFLQTALEENSLEADVTLMALMLGLRAHEVVERVTRDVDADGAILWVPKSKTRAGVRQLLVPELLRERLLTRCEGKATDALIFTRDGKRTTPTRHWLHYHVVRLAKKAGVPRVTPHGLRRTWMTLGVLGGGAAALERVAKDGGHADKGVTATKHYIAPGALESATSSRVVEWLGGDRVENATSPLAPNPSREQDTGVSNPYETRPLVTDGDFTVTNPDNPEVN